MWQPIETAPRDGTVFLVYSVFEGVQLCRWMGCGTVWDPKTQKTEYRSNFCTLPYGGASQGLTHWMPAPSKPELTSARVEACSGYFDPNRKYPR